MRLPRVLIIEDDFPLAASLRDILVELGYAVGLARDGLEGLEEAHRERPDLIVLDLLLPRLDGRAFWAAQRRDPGIAEVPVLVLSASQEDAGLGTAGFFSKPSEVRRLLGTIRDLLPPAPSAS